MKKVDSKRGCDWCEELKLKDRQISWADKQFMISCVAETTEDYAFTKFTWTSKAKPLAADWWKPLANQCAGHYTDTSSMVVTDSVTDMEGAVGYTSQDYFWKDSVQKGYAQ